MGKKVRVEKIDGLNPKDLKNLRNAIRQIWHRSHVRKLAVKRCIGADGFSYCERCGKRAPHVSIDHKLPVGEVLSPKFIERMFTPSKNLQGLCKPCHKPKTNKENAKRRALKRRTETEKDFY